MKDVLPKVYAILSGAIIDEEILLILFNASYI